MRKYQDIVGVILAGGRSSRMGKNKALLEVDGVSLIERTATTLKKVFDRVILIGDGAQRYEFLNLPTYSDVIKNCGPLGGMHSAFVNTHAQFIFVMACDTPFIPPDLVTYICEFKPDAEIKIPLAGGRPQPLCGQYSRKVLSSIEARIKEGSLRVESLIDDFHSVLIPITQDLPFYDNRLFLNFNTPAEFETLKHDETPGVLPRFNG